MRIRIQLPKIMRAWILVATLLKPRSWKAETHRFVTTHHDTYYLLQRWPGVPAVLHYRIGQRTGQLAGGPTRRWIPWQPWVFVNFFAAVEKWDPDIFCWTFLVDKELIRYRDSHQLKLVQFVGASKERTSCYQFLVTGAGSECLLFCFV